MEMIQLPIEGDLSVAARNSKLATFFTVAGAFVVIASATFLASGFAEQKKTLDAYKNIVTIQHEKSEKLKVDLAVTRISAEEFYGLLMQVSTDPLVSEAQRNDAKRRAKLIRDMLSAAWPDSSALKPVSNTAVNSKE